MIKRCDAARYDAQLHHRRSIRLKTHVYSDPGAYFVTICTQDKACSFGNVVEGRVELSVLGQTARNFWCEIPRHFGRVQLDEFVVMPNHVHGIIVIIEPCRGVKFNAPTKGNRYYSRISPNGGTLSVIVRSYKTAVSHWCKQNGHEHFQWQRNYYDHIVRNEEDLAQIREYIANNPLKWDLDRENPEIKA